MIKKEGIVYLNKSSIENNYYLSYEFSKVGEEYYGENLLKYKYKISVIGNWIKIIL